MSNLNGLASDFENSTIKVNCLTCDSERFNVGDLLKEINDSQLSIGALINRAHCIHCQTSNVSVFLDGKEVRSMNASGVVRGGSHVRGYGF